MIVFPAVDIKDGLCVRLEKGRPDTAKKYYDEPWRAGVHWERSGAEWLHVVDLDGALAGSDQNSGAVKELVEKTAAKVQLGGGMRSAESIDVALSTGVRRVVVGTMAARHPDWAVEQCRLHPGSIVIALDAENGMVSVDGWQQSSGTPVEELAQTLQAGGPAAFLYTDVERDGMLSHPNFEGLQSLLQCTSIPVIASGGVSCLEDIEELGRCGADGLITGKALYEGKFRLEDALDIASGFETRLNYG